MLKAGEEYVFTTKEGANGTDGRIGVNYDGFVDDVSIGDVLLVRMPGADDALRVWLCTDYLALRGVTPPLNSDDACGQVDGGIQTFKVKDKSKTDVKVEVIDGGEFK